MESLPKILNWCHDNTILLFKLNTNNTYSPWKVKNGSDIYEQTKIKKLLQFSYTYLITIYNCYE